MSKVFVPQQIAPRLAAHGGAIATIKTASSTAATTRLSLHAKNNRMSSKPSDSINSKTEQNPKRVPPFRYNTNGYNTNGKPDTTPLSSPKQHNHRGNNHQRHHSDSTITNSVPQSPNQLDFDDFNSSSSIMEFLRQERQCANGGIESPNDHDSEADAESIFQEVSRLADNSDTRSVDELLREAEILLQHQEFMDNVNEENRKSPRFHCATQTTSIRMNSKYTKRIENVNPRSTLNKIVNGYGSEISMLDECTPPLMTPETPTVTSSLSDVGAANSNTTFNNFVNNMVTASVISMESAPPNFPDDSTATITQCSSNEDNTTGKDVTTKQIDDEDTDDSADTVPQTSRNLESVHSELAISNSPNTTYRPLCVKCNTTTKTKRKTRFYCGVCSKAMCLQHGKESKTYICDDCQ